ncbi:hypothetical protein RRG08_053317 [Elysia crispata]|uniref:Uncharacterized protein n=1 Tax=Elysia crispata TaxID=231223 RepID=A0AAE0ZKT0_9GAST|nr:hypothetical protein RRG08_053317 [Elysia crispata]
MAESAAVDRLDQDLYEILRRVETLSKPLLITGLGFRPELNVSQSRDLPPLGPLEIPLCLRIRFRVKLKRRALRIPETLEVWITCYTRKVGSLRTIFPRFRSEGVEITDGEAIRFSPNQPSPV